MSAPVMTPAMAGADLLAAVRQLLASYDGVESVSELRNLADELTAALRTVRGRITRITKTTTTDGALDGQQGQGQQAAAAGREAGGGAGALRAVDEAGPSRRAGVGAEGPVRRLDARQGLDPAREAEEPGWQQLGVLDVPWPAWAGVIDAQIAYLGQPAGVEGDGAPHPTGSVAVEAAGDAGPLPGVHDPEATAEQPAVGSGQTGATERIRWVDDERAEETTVELPPLSAEPLAAGMGRHRYVRGDLTIWELLGGGRRRRVASWLFWTGVAVAVFALLTAAWLLAAAATGYILDTLPPGAAKLDPPAAATTVPVPVPGGGR